MIAEGTDHSDPSSESEVLLLLLLQEDVGSDLGLPLSSASGSASGGSRKVFLTTRSVCHVRGTSSELLALVAAMCPARP
eukprot:CAMPEP_0168421728 /NCGR_PEP_ID=MMETSP0228-20121227/33429_1 /TAXON_ID=133427 /ORGANISM="Protoceratium reticulatum, Strain CCCM 535 (=CCMP 1889)" /LENGTH=78 /DNA_ID=CAMNT_0008435641 /DNA_START=445 /DNA_END=677 /DNA_ORIENTATION=-